MAELTLTTFLTVDGVMQAPGGPTEDPSGGFPHGGWLVPHFDADTGTAMIEFFSKADAFLLGRTTYDIFSAYWPKVTDPGDPIASKLNSLPKFVASRTRTAFSWSGSSHIRDVVKEVPGLKQAFAREVQVHGSGTGKRLFGGGAVPAAVTLVRSHTTGSGVVVSVYRRAGSLKTGSIDMPAAPDSVN